MYARASSGVPCGCRTSTRSNSSSGQRSSWSRDYGPDMEWSRGSRRPRFCAMKPIDRRSFVKHGALAGAIAVTHPGQLVRAGAPPKPIQVSAFELDEVTIAQLQERMTSGKYTARALAEAYLGRIKERSEEHTSELQ